MGNRLGREAHGRMWVSERTVMPWIMAEADRFAPPYDAASMSSEAEARRETLDAKRARWIEQYGEGLIDKPERDRRLAVVDADLAEVISRADTLRAIPPRAIDWTSPPERLNEFLRSIWRHVELNEVLGPIRADWIIPEWRATGA